MADIPEDFAVRVLQKAIDKGKAGELLETLFGGGSVTIDKTTDELVFINGDQVQQIAASDT